jgi:hypothetical protein
VNETLLLAIATLALVVGPLLQHLGRPLPWLSHFVDGATIGGILVLSLLHLMPEAGAHLGLWALALFAFGLVLPGWAERLLERSHQGLKLTVGVLVAVLFLVHELIESAALASKAANARLSLATLFVVVGHRLPLGLLLWGHTRRRFGNAWSLVLLGVVVAATWFGPELAPSESGEFSAALSALLAGGLLHLALQHAPAAGIWGNRLWRNAWSSAGLIASSLIMFYFLAGPGHAHEHEHGGTHLPAELRALALESAGPILIGLIGAALIEAYLPLGAVGWLSRGPRLMQTLKGVLVGAPMPVCSCGVLPIYRSLIRRGASRSAAVALLVAAPEIGVDSLVLSLDMLGRPVTVARLLCALLLALVMGLVVGRLAGERAGHPPAESAASPATRVGWPALQRGFLETWGHLGPWILFGLAAAVLIEPWISTEWVRSTPAWLQLVVLCAAGLPTYICASAATPLAAVLLAKGFAPGAVIAFLLTGPATNWTTFGALSRLHSRSVALAFVATALAAALAMGALVNAWWDLGGFVAAAAPVHGEQASPLDVIAASLLALLTLWLLLREGPRAFLGQLWGGEGAGHDHDHPSQPSAAAGAARAPCEALASRGAGSA